MIDGLRDVLDKQIAELKLLVSDRFGALQKQQNVFLQFVLDYAVSSAQVVDVSIVAFVMILYTRRRRKRSVFPNELIQ